ncbi:MAG: arsenite methyltransferase [Nitrospinae bacterium]|nr:arsenite methyltransferase [Nitrospinota bacterium]
MSAHNDKVRTIVRESYAKVAEVGGSGCGCTPGGCCGDPEQDMIVASAKMGYDPAKLAALPGGANLGLGCGNPAAIASLKGGETVLDLGAGAGIDCFLAANEVGPTGRVIGVDMTPAMLLKARENGRKGNYGNVEFRLGEIEHLPVADGSVDVIISNCVINLSPDKGQVFREAYRVLKPGGRVAVSDIVLSAPLPDDVKDDPYLLSGCVAGAVTVAELRTLMEDAGLSDVRIVPKDESRSFIAEWAPERKVEEFVVSASIEGKKPQRDN